MKVIFGVSHVPDAAGVMQHTAANPNAPAVLAYLPGSVPSSAPSSGRSAVGFRQGRRLDRHPDHLRRDGGRLRRRRLHHDAGLTARRRRNSTFDLHVAVRRPLRGQRHRQRFDLPHHRRHLRPPAGGRRSSAGRRPSPPTAPSSRRSSSASRSPPAPAKLAMYGFRRLLRPVHPRTGGSTCAPVRSGIKKRKPLFEGPERRDRREKRFRQFPLWVSAKGGFSCTSIHEPPFSTDSVTFPTQRAFSGDHGVTTGEDRTWEDAYRDRWAHDKIVRSTHGVNCTAPARGRSTSRAASSPGKRSRPTTAHALGHAQPRAARCGARRPRTRGICTAPTASSTRWCAPPARALARGAAVQRSRSTPGRRSSQDDAKRKNYQSVRGLGGFRARSSWDEVNRDRRRRQRLYDQEIRGPTASSASRRSRHVDGFLRRRQPLPVLIGGVCMSFYDWYCDLPPASPQIWGEQTDVPESADWYNATFIIAWARTCRRRARRTPTSSPRCATRGTKTVAVTPDYSEVAKLRPTSG